MFQARWDFFFGAAAEEFFSVSSPDLELICDANRINAAPKTQLASAMMTLRPPDLLLFSAMSFIKTSPGIVEGRKKSKSYTAFRPVSSRENESCREKALSISGYVCLKLAIVVWP